MSFGDLDNFYTNVKFRRQPSAVKSFDRKKVLTLQHEQWLDQALELARLKRYDDAREQAMRVIRQDGRSTKALWIVACVTDSLNERRNALKALLRVEPDNEPAHQMLRETEREFRAQGTTDASVGAVGKKSSSPIHTINPDSTP